MDSKSDLKLEDQQGSSSSYHDGGIYLVDGNGQGIRIEENRNNSKLMIRISESEMAEPICIQINQSMNNLANSNNSSRTVLVVPGGPSSAPPNCGPSENCQPISKEIEEVKTEENNTVLPPPVVNRRRRSRNRNGNGNRRDEAGTSANLIQAGSSNNESTLPNYSTLPSSEHVIRSDAHRVSSRRITRTSSNQSRPLTNRQQQILPQNNPPLPSSQQQIPQLPIQPEMNSTLNRMRLNLSRILHLDKPWCCCCVNQTVSIRWFIIVIFMIGVCCTVTGTVLGATRFNSNNSNNKEHFTLSLLMIGVGVVLLTVSGIAWKMMTSSPNSLDSGTTDCSAMLGLTVDRNENRFVNNRNYYGVRPHHPYSAMMYPSELLGSTTGNNFREPPPSYSASMQEYRLRLLLYERSNPTFVPNFYNPPPPYYYNISSHHGGNLLHHHIHHQNRRFAPMPPPIPPIPPPGLPPLHHLPVPYPLPHHPQQNHQLLEYYNSRPPSYRSRSSIDQPSSMQQDLSMQLTEDATNTQQGPNQQNQPTPQGQITHTRDPSIISYLSHQSTDNMSVVSEHTVNLQSPTGRSTVVTVLHAVSNCEDVKENSNNNVTIVQTNSDSPNSNSSVIVTVSGHQSNSNNIIEEDNRNEFDNQIYYDNNSVQILAHL